MLLYLICSLSTQDIQVLAKRVRSIYSWPCLCHTPQLHVRLLQEGILLCSCLSQKKTYSCKVRFVMALTHYNENALFTQKRLVWLLCYLFAAALIKFCQIHIIQPQNSRKYIYQKNGMTLKSLITAASKTKTSQQNSWCNENEKIHKKTKSIKQCCESETMQ